MERDVKKIIYGIIYISFIVLQWVFLFVFPYTYGDFSTHYTGIFFDTFPGKIVFFALLSLIPNVILDIIFMGSTKSKTSGRVAFGLGLPEWIVGLVGFTCFWDAFGIHWGPYPYILDFVIIGLGICLICQTIFGILLFARSFKAEDYPPKESISPLPSPSSQLSPPCPQCNTATVYVHQYNRYYCKACQKYI